METTERYKILKMGAAYVVIDTAQDTTLCYCTSKEYANALMGAMNYMVSVGEAQNALEEINVDI